MKWKSRIIEDGTTKTVNRFAFLPVRMSNGFTVWLIEYKILKGYLPTRHELNFEGKQVAFKNSNWVTLSKAINE